MNAGGDCGFWGGGERRKGERGRAREKEMSARWKRGPQKCAVLPNEPTAISSRRGSSEAADCCERYSTTKSKMVRRAERKEKKKEERQSKR